MNKPEFSTPRQHATAFVMSLAMTLAMLLGTDLLATQEHRPAHLQMASQPAASAPSAS